MKRQVLSFSTMSLQACHHTIIISSSLRRHHHHHIVREVHQSFRISSLRPVTGPSNARLGITGIGVWHESYNSLIDMIVTLRTFLRKYTLSFPGHNRHRWTRQKKEKKGSKTEVKGLKTKGLDSYLVSIAATQTFHVFLPVKRKEILFISGTLKHWKMPEKS